MGIDLPVRRFRIKVSRMPILMQLFLATIFSNWLSITTWQCLLVAIPPAIMLLVFSPRPVHYLRMVAFITAWSLVTGLFQVDPKFWWISLSEMSRLPLMVACWLPVLGDFTWLEAYNIGRIAFFLSSSSRHRLALLIWLPRELIYLTANFHRNFTHCTYRPSLDSRNHRFRRAIARLRIFPGALADELKTFANKLEKRLPETMID